VNSPLICSDANIALKLVLAEPDSQLAQQLWAEWEAQDMDIITSPLWAYEVTSVIRNKVYLGKITPDEGEEAFAAVHKLGVRLVSTPDLHAQAWELAKRFNRPTTYDTHYLALALAFGCEFWTADRRLYNAVKEELSWVKWLGDFRP
jgi:predicted nucleic acid-binding protein